MCVATLALVGTIAAAGGSIASGLYGSAVASNNAKQAQYDATYSREVGDVKAADRSLEGADKVGKIKTGYAASGIDIGSGSAQDVIASQKGATDVDIERIYNNSDMAAYGYTTQAKNFENESGMKMLEGVTGAGATLAEKAPSLNWKWGG